MFKLLTEEHKLKVKSEYDTRRLIVMLAGLSSVFAAGIIGLLPSYVLSNARQNEVVEQARILEVTEEGLDESELMNWLKSINEQLKTLDPELDTDRPSEFIEEVLLEKTLGIRLTGFSWIKAKNSPTMSINGIASDRQTLAVFQDSIESSGHFSEVTLPISNFARDKNIDFQIKFSLARASSTSQKSQ